MAVLSKVLDEPIDVGCNTKGYENDGTEDQCTDVANVDVFMPIIDRKVCLCHGYVNAGVILNKSIAFGEIEYLEFLLCFCHKVHQFIGNCVPEISQVCLCALNR